MQKVWIIGPGAVGSWLAAHLASLASKSATPAFEVSLIARDEASRLRKVASESNIAHLKITGDESLTADVPVLPWSQIDQIPGDVILVFATKVYDLPSAVGELFRRPRADGRPLALLLQNGIGVFEEISRSIPMLDWARLVSWTGVKRDESDPTVLKVSGIRGVKRGDGFASLEWASPFHCEDRAEAFAQLLAQSGIAVARSQSVVELEWRKGLANSVINGICAIAGVDNGTLLTDPALKAMAGMLFDEAVKVAAKEGVIIEDSERDRVFDIARSTGANLNSTLQDLRAGSRTEIPWFNGAIERLAARHDLRAPTHSMITQKIAQLEKTKG